MLLPGGLPNRQRWGRSGQRGRCCSASQAQQARGGGGGGSLVAAEGVLTGAAVAGARRLQRRHVCRQALVDVQAHLCGNESFSAQISCHSSRRTACEVQHGAALRLTEMGIQTTPGDTIACCYISWRPNPARETSKQDRLPDSREHQNSHLAAVLWVGVGDKPRAAGAHISGKSVLARRFAILPAERHDSIQSEGTDLRCLSQAATASQLLT